MRILQNTKRRPVALVSFGPGGRTLFAGGSGGYDLWDLATSSHTYFSSHNAKYFYGCTCDPLGRWAYVSNSLGGFRMIALDGSGVQRLPGSPYDQHVISFSLAANGERLALCRGGAGRNRVECWSVHPSGSLVPLWSLRDGEPADPNDPIYLNTTNWFTNAVALSSDGRIVATSENRRSSGPDLLVIRDETTGRVVAELGRTAIGVASRPAFAPDDRTLFTWDERVIERWDVAAGRQTAHIPPPGRAYFRGMVCHPSDLLVITVSGDGQAHYWDSATLSLVRTLKWPVGKLHSVAMSPDGMLAAAGGDKGQIVIWDVDV